MRQRTAENNCLYSKKKKKQHRMVKSSPQDTTEICFRIYRNSQYMEVRYFDHRSMAMILDSSAISKQR